MATARETFVLADPKTFTPVIVRAGEKIPDWAIDLVTHPDILGGDVETEEIVSFDNPAETVEVPVTEPQTEEDADDEDGELDETQDFTLEDDGDKPDETWLKAAIADYLVERGVSVSGGETKDELLAKVEQGD